MDNDPTEVYFDRIEYRWIFAGLIMPGLLIGDFKSGLTTNAGLRLETPDDIRSHLAAECVRLADALIAELEK